MASAAGIASGIGMGVGVGSVYSGLSDILKTAVTWGKWKAVGQSMGYPLMANVLQKLLDADKDEMSGLSAKGMVDTIWGFIDRTLDFSWMIDSQIASQLFVQMVQQSVAYAIHSAHAGSIGTVCNVYSGSSPLAPSSAPVIGQNTDLLDRATRGFLTAELGMNMPSTTFEYNVGVNKRIEEVYNRVIAQANSLLDEWNDVALSYYRQYHTLGKTKLQDALEMKETIVTRAYGMLETIANEHLARVAELTDAVEGARYWFEAALMNEDELKQLSIRVGLEQSSSEANFDMFLEEITNEIETSSATQDEAIMTAMNDMKEVELRYSLLIKDVMAGLFEDVGNFVRVIIEEADKTLGDVGAYRNTLQAMNMDEATVIGESEMSPEIELYRMRYRRWETIPSHTEITEFSNPRGFAWSTDDVGDMGKPTPSTAIIMPRRTWEVCDRSVVDIDTSSIPLTPLESVD